MSEASSVKSICLVRLSALGDVVLILPLVRYLQRSFPEARITWIIGRGAHEAVAGLVDEGIELIVIDKPRSLKDYLGLRRRFAGREFDALLCLQASWRANWIYPCIRAKRKIGYGADRAKDLHRFFVREQIAPARPHLVDGFLQFAEALGLPFPKSVEWRLPLPASAEAWADATLPQVPFVAISPCASKPERDWPTDRYVAVLKYLQAANSGPIVVFGGASLRERSMTEKIIAEACVPVVDLVGKTRIPQLLAALSRCRFLIAPDTGAVHIARAFGRPVLGLYAVAPASRTGPYGASGHCVDHFDDALRILLNKVPEAVPWAQRVHHPEAMSLITVDEVTQRIDALLRTTANSET